MERLEKIGVADQRYAEGDPKSERLASGLDKEINPKLPNGQPIPPAFAEAAREWRRENVKQTVGRKNRCDAVSAGPRRQFIRDSIADMVRNMEGMTLALLDEHDESAEIYWLTIRAIGMDISRSLRALLGEDRG